MTPARMDRVEAAMLAALAFKDALNRHDVHGILRLLSPDCVFEDFAPPPDGTVYAGKDAISEYYEGFFGK